MRRRRYQKQSHAAPSLISTIKAALLLQTANWLITGLMSLAILLATCWALFGWDMMLALPRLLIQRWVTLYETLHNLLGLFH